MVDIPDRYPRRTGLKGLNSLPHLANAHTFLQRLASWVVFRWSQQEAAADLDARAGGRPRLLIRGFNSGGAGHDCHAIQPCCLPSEKQREGEGQTCATSSCALLCWAETQQHTLLMAQTWYSLAAPQAENLLP